MNHRLIGDDDVRLTPEDLAALRENLEEQRRFRREQLRQITGATQPAAGGTPSPETAALTEVQVKLAASARMVLNDVEAALERMSRGRYGKCERCGRSIAPALLTVVPQARRCAPCRQAGEPGR